MTARLVTIGDSLTQGFQHGAIRRTEWSFPAILARALSIQPFLRPDFSGGAPNGVGGPLLDLELLLRELSDICKDQVDLLEIHRVGAAVLQTMDKVEGYWERGDGTHASATGPLHHNLGCWGFDVLDAVTLSDAVCQKNIPTPHNHLVVQLPERAMYRSARRALNPAQNADQAELKQLELAELHGKSQPIENLLVWLGGNNALRTCATLGIHLSEGADLKRLSHERRCTLWRPEDFDQSLGQLERALVNVTAERVFLGTVPHVTIPPVTRGVTPSFKQRGVPEREGKYYEYYTRFWTWDRHFSPLFSEKLTRKEAKQIDDTIDRYNDSIRKLATKRGYHVIDFCKLLDELAFRRNDGQPPYRLPPGLVAALGQNPATRHRVRPDGVVLLDTRFMGIPAEPPSENASSEEWQKQYRGGIFGLDGVHPTTIGYGIIAHEVLKVFADKGVPGADPNTLDWKGIVAADTLVCNPPRLLVSLEGTLDRVFAPLQLLFRLFDKLAG